ncbi:MAG: hypothetical protein GXO50_02690, partial [Chlorobi bacterium]|nr:hypothetical protein [Chlorobiota bacterium]
MKNVTTSIILFLILNFSIKAQKVETYRYGGGGTNSGLRRLDNQETEIEGLDGSSYYDNAWRIGSFKLLSNNTLKDKLIKYNIRKNIIEVKDNNEIKTFSAGNISELI